MARVEGPPPWLLAGEAIVVTVPDARLRVASPVAPTRWPGLSLVSDSSLSFPDGKSTAKDLLGHNREPGTKGTLCITTLRSVFLTQPPGALSEEEKLLRPAFSEAIFDPGLATTALLARRAQRESTPEMGVGTRSVQLMKASWGKRPVPQLVAEGRLKFLSLQGDAGPFLEDRRDGWRVSILAREKTNEVPVGVWTRTASMMILLQRELDPSGGIKAKILEHQAAKGAYVRYSVIYFDEVPPTVTYSGVARLLNEGGARISPAIPALESLAGNPTHGPT